MAGRPRQNTSGLERCPPVAITFPDLTEREWTAFRAALPNETGLCDTLGNWRSEFAAQASSATSTFKAKNQIENIELLIGTRAAAKILEISLWQSDRFHWQHVSRCHWGQVRFQPYTGSKIRAVQNARKVIQEGA